MNFYTQMSTHKLRNEVQVLISQIRFANDPDKKHDLEGLLAQAKEELSKR